MREPPKPGEQIVVLYREGESKYNLTAVCTAVVAVTSENGAGFVWFRAGDYNVDRWRRLDEEGIEWARWSGSHEDFEMHGGWCPLVPVLLAARRLAGLGS